MGAFDDLIPQANPGGAFADLIPEKPPVPVKLGPEGFPDAMLQTLQEQTGGRFAQQLSRMAPGMLSNPILAPIAAAAMYAGPEGIDRNIASGGLQLSKAWHGLTGGNDPAYTQGAAVAAKEAPAGALAGDVLKYSPAALASGIVAPAAIVATIAGATTPGDFSKRADAAATEGGTALAFGAGMKALAAGAKYVGNMGSLAKARAVLEDIIGTNNMPEALRMARGAAAAGEDISGAQTLAPLNRPTVAALGYATDNLAPNEAYALWLRQRAADLAPLEQMARGSTSAEAKAARDEIASKISTTLRPKLYQEYAAADQANQTIGRLAPRLADAEAGRIAALQNQGVALTDAAQQASLAQGVRPTPAQIIGEYPPGNSPRVHSVTQPEGLPAGAYPVPGMPRVSGQVMAGNEAAARQATETAADFGTAAAQRKSAADTIRYQLDSLGAYGLQPLQVTGLISDVSQQLASPLVKANPLKARALTMLRDKLAEVAGNGGAVDAEVLHAIRKASINDVVDTLVVGGATKQDAARAVAEFRPAIDNLIEGAGGTEWRALMHKYSKGYEAIDRLELLDKARHLYSSSPKKFMDLVKGESPNVVQKIMTGSFDMLDATSPNKMQVLTKIAANVERDSTLAKQAAKGGDVVAERLKVKGLASLIPNILYRPAMIAHAGLKEGETAANRAMMRHLETAMRNPQELQKLLELLPVEQRNALVQMLSQLSGSGIPAVAGGTIADLAQRR